MEINKSAGNSNCKYAEIRTNNGVAYMNERVYKILKLYDYAFIADSIDKCMEEMRNTGTLNTGMIDLPSGFHMFGSFFCVAGIGTYIGIRHHISTHDQSISHLNLSSIGYYTDCHKDNEPVSIKEYAKRLFELKKRYIGEYNHDLGINIRTSFYDDVIDWERCFDESHPDQLYKLFHDMQNNFMFCDIECMIYAHSLFGVAYTNAVKRVSEYNNESELVCIRVPESYIVYDEFRKLLRKYYFRGIRFSDIIFACYVADYLNPNKKVE